MLNVAGISSATMAAGQNADHPRAISADIYSSLPLEVPLDGATEHRLA
jgi:hypothetical protein